MLRPCFFHRWQVAFHPFKSESSWQRCMQNAGGWGGIFCIGVLRCHGWILHLSSPLHLCQPNLVVQYPRNRIPRPRTSKNIQEHPIYDYQKIHENPKDLASNHSKASHPSKLITGSLLSERCLVQCCPVHRRPGFTIVKSLTSFPGRNCGGSKLHSGKPKKIQCSKIPRWNDL